MDKGIRIIFIGNYQLDKQESMLRFAKLLCTGFQKAGYDAHIWWPKAFFGKLFKATTTGFPKWVGYIDKWIIFPFILRRRQQRQGFKNANVRFQICDHSNSPYLKHLPTDRTCITCHDVLAIRGSMGFADAYAPASSTGKYYQQWILGNLLKANCIACNSQNTLQQLTKLAAERNVQPKNWRVIHLSYNGEYTLMQSEEAKPLLAEAGIYTKERPFILHVGNGHIRKNRIFLLDVLAQLKDKWKGCVCFAGKVDDVDLINRARKLQIEDRIILLSKPSNTLLRALYSSCEAFMYPSFSEGFPWPTIEAQSCGAPVIASDIEPMPEITGTGALHASPTDAKSFADAFLQLQDTNFRNEMIRRGFENCQRFAPPKMIDDYLLFHNLVRIQAYSSTLAVEKI